MELTEVTKFRRAVLTGLARFTWQGTLPEHVYDILYSVVTEDSPRVRCCVHKETGCTEKSYQYGTGAYGWIEYCRGIKNCVDRAC